MRFMILSGGLLYGCGSGGGQLHSADPGAGRTEAHADPVGEQTIVGTERVDVHYELPASLEVCQDCEITIAWDEAPEGTHRVLMMSLSLSVAELAQREADGDPIFDGVSMGDRGNWSWEVRDMQDYAEIVVSQEDWEALSAGGENLVVVGTMGSDERWERYLVPTATGTSEIDIRL